MRPHLTPETREVLLAGLREFAGPAREAGIPLETRVVEGDPVAVILGVARELRAEVRPRRTWRGGPPARC